MNKCSKRRITGKYFKGLRLMRLPRTWVHKLLAPALVTLALSAFTAAGAYLVSFVEEVRVARLDIVNKQIEKFYGPLYAVAQADDVTWTQFRDKYILTRKGCAVFEDECCRPLTADDVTVWRTWMSDVFQPMNVRMEQAIVSNVQLVIGNSSSLPQSFRNLIAHTEGYKAVIASWKDSRPKDAGYIDTKNNVSVSNYNTDELLNCAKDSYELLKSRQAQLELKNPISGFAALIASPLLPPCSCEPELKGASPPACSPALSKATSIFSPKS